MSYLRIAICEDETEYRNRFIGTVRGCLEDLKIGHDIDEYESGEALCADVSKIMEYNVIFLDIKMKEIDGIETAGFIRRYNENVIIVFVTSLLEYSREGYKVGAFRYLFKGEDDNPENIRKELETICELLSETGIKKVFRFREGTYQLCPYDISIIESKGHYLIYRVKTDENTDSYSMRERLDKIQSEYEGYDFVRIHKSYMVNMKQVAEYTSTEVIMSDDTTCPLSRSYKKAFELSYLKYKGRIR